MHRTFHRIFALFLILAIRGLPASFAAGAASAADRPNILWITCEDTSPDLGCYGDAEARTPNLDKFASEGMLLTNAFSIAGVILTRRAIGRPALHACATRSYNVSVSRGWVLEPLPMRLDRITVTSDVMGGRPCIRGMRFPVSRILGMLAAGEDEATILANHPDLEPDDIRQALAYASMVADNQIVVLGTG